MIVNGTLYEVGHLDLKELSALQSTYNHLPEDQYAEKRLRSRRYSCYRLKGDNLVHLPHKEFMQTKALNKAVGDVERHFEEIDAKLESNPAFVKMFQEFKAHTNLSEDSIIEAHQIRWHCKRFVKIPAPEGIHRDGFDFIAMFMLTQRLRSSDGVVDQAALQKAITYYDRISKPVALRIMRGSVVGYA